MLTLQEIAGSRYLLYRNLVDCGFAAGRAAQAVDVLLGPDHDDAAETIEWRPEPGPEYVPTPEDLESYGRWSREVEDRLLEARMASDYDDVMDEASRVTDHDVARVTGCIG